MSITSKFKAAVEAILRAGYVARSLEPAYLPTAPTLPESTHAALLDVMLAYYEANDLYAILGRPPSDAGGGGPRNPISAWVDFYGEHLWPTDMTVKAERPAVAELLDKAAQRGNWQEQLGIAAMELPLFGEMFIKTQPNADGEPYNVLIDPREVVELDLDVRGYVEWIRIEKAAMLRDPATGEKTQYMHVEVWQPGCQRVWRFTKHNPLGKSDLAALPKGSPPPDMLGYVERRFEDGSLSVPFVPIAYARFRSSRAARGLPGPLLAIEDIDTANMLASNMHRQLRANRPDKKMTARDVASSSELPGADVLRQADGGTIQEVVIDSDEVIYKVPRGYDLETMIASLDYDAMLAIVNAQVGHIVTRLPELDYYHAMREAGANASNAALETRLTPALNRARAARERALACMVRANGHLLTFGQATGAAGYEVSQIGTYEDGSFEHEYPDTPMIPRDRTEKAKEAETLAGLGLPYGALRVAGYSVDEAELVALGGPTDAPPTRQRASNATPEEVAALNAGSDALLERLNNA